MAFIRDPFCSDRCPSTWRSHEPAPSNFARPRCRLAISVAIARKRSRCCWACSVPADRSRRPARLSTRWAYPVRNKSWKRSHSVSSKNWSCATLVLSIPTYWPCFSMASTSKSKTGIASSRPVFTWPSVCPRWQKTSAGLPLEIRP
jgi:hypothetical protein